MKLLSKTDSIRIILFGLFCISAFCLKASGDDLKKNQAKAFPNYLEPPTDKANVKPADNPAPKLSHALLETDPTRPLKKSDFFDTIQYANYKITRGELEQIYNFADQNRDDLIDSKEWDSFSELFIFPFEACDKNGDNILDAKEWKDCYDADPKSKIVQFRRKFEADKYNQMVDVMRMGGKPEMNFSDYLFLRKALFGWKQCHSNIKYMAKAHFRCALIAALPQKYTSKMDFEMMYEVGRKLSGDKQLIELDFLSYLRVTYFVYIFSIFNSSTDGAILEKPQWLKAIREDRFPNNFEEEEVNMVYDLISTYNINNSNKVPTIDFPSWAMFFNLHRLFNKYSQEKPLQLTKAEFLNLLRDPFTDKRIVMAMDASQTLFDQPAYLEASLALNRFRNNEKDFFFSRFKQDASFFSASAYNKTTINATYYDMQPNEKSRETFFTIMADNNKKYWTKKNLFRGMLLSNLYIEIQGEEVRPISVTTFLQKLQPSYDIVRPPINMDQRKNYIIYKTLPPEILMDLLMYLSLENFSYKFEIHNMSDAELINETLLKIILKDYGMAKMPDTVIDLSMKKYDSLRRRMYDPMSVASNTLIVQAVAAENARSAKLIKDNGITVNNEISRKFPGLRRKFASSERV